MFSGKTELLHPVSPGSVGPHVSHTPVQERQQVLAEELPAETEETVRRRGLEAEDRTVTAAALGSSGVFSVKGSSNTKSATLQGGTAWSYPLNKFVVDIQNPPSVMSSEKVNNPPGASQQALDTDLSTTIKTEKDLADPLDSDSCITVKCESIDDSPAEKFIFSSTGLLNRVFAPPHKTKDSSTMTVMQASYITSLQQECYALEGKCFELENKKKQLSLSEEAFKDNIAKVKYLTGMPTFNVLMDMFGHVRDHLVQQQRLTKFQQYVMTLMLLRNNYSMQDLAYRFCLNALTVSEVFHDVLRVCMERLVPALVSWPEGELSECNFPTALKDHFPKCVAIITFIEIDVEKSAGATVTKETHTHKNFHTVKYLVAVSPKGSLAYISKGFEGSQSEVRIAESCGILDKTDSGDEILADKGFNKDATVGLYGAAVCEGKKKMHAIKMKNPRYVAAQSSVAKLMGAVHATKRNYAFLQSPVPSKFLKGTTDTGLTALDQIVCLACALTSVSEKVN